MPLSPITKIKDGPAKESASPVKVKMPPPSKAPTPIRVASERPKTLASLSFIGRFSSIFSSSLIGL